MAEFIQPVNALFTDARLTDGDRTVYCLLLTFADYGTLANCRPSVATVAKRGGRDRSAVVRSLTKLVELGWVTRQARKTADGDSDTSLYSFPFQVVGAETHLPSRSNAPTVVAETHLPVGAQMHLGVVAETHHNLEPVHQEPVTDTSSAPVKPVRPKKVKPPTESSIAFHSVWALWERYMIPAGQNDEKPDARKWGSTLAALAKYDLETLERTMSFHAKEYDKKRPFRPYAIEGWFAESNIKAFVHMARDAKSVIAPQPESIYPEYKPRTPRSQP